MNKLKEARFGYEKSNKKKKTFSSGNTKNIFKY